MTSFRTALGEEFALERRLPSIGWRPSRRGGDLLDVDMPGFDGDDGILAIIGLVVLAIFAVLVLLPLLLFVAEAALVIALIIPLTVIALVVGIKQHTVVLTRVADGAIVDQRQVHGLVGSVRAARALRSGADAGRYRAVPGQRAGRPSGPPPGGSTPPPGTFGPPGSQF